MLLQAIKLSKAYDKKMIFKDISFSLEQGECLGIIGRNGAGKSTLINTIINPQKLTSGEIMFSFGAENIKDHIGVQFQEAFFDTGLKVIEVCDIFRTIYGVKKSKIKEYLEEFELVHVAKRYTSQLSGGEKQKLNIILALLNEPDVLLFDELTTGLDTDTRHKIYATLRKLKENNQTIIIVTHYYEELNNLADKVLIMKKEGHEVLDVKTNNLEEILGGKIYEN